jgi:putative ABC transport system substrate-binding protein
MLVRRSALIVVAALMLLAGATPPVAGQAPARVPTVGVLSPGPATSPATTRSREAFERGLTELGWIPGKTIRIDSRHADGKQERLTILAGELVSAHVDVIVARATPSIRAAQRATTTVPIVMSATGLDPVEAGFVTSLGRPGRNMTGLTLLTQDLLAKQLELLKEIRPALSSVVVLGSTATPLPQSGRHTLDAAARAMGVTWRQVDVRTAGDLEGAIADIGRRPAVGLLVRADPFVLEPNAKRVVSLALKHRLPAVYWIYTYVEDGGLVSYGADLFEIHRRSAYFVDRILKGARPAELPVEEPNKFSLTINLKTARALDLTLPPSILARANEVIQ